MSTLAELVKQREELEQQISALQTAERSDAIAKVLALMSDHGLTPADISGKPTKASGGPTKQRSVAVKYRDKAGNAWTGRGLKPRWLVAALASGHKAEDFAV